MKIQHGDLFAPTSDVDAILIPTNGYIRKDGACVMGRGVAKWSTELWPGIQYELGREIELCGNVVNYLEEREFPNKQICRVYSFPVKHNWWEDADINLITRSAKQVVQRANNAKWGEIWLPAVGCGNGKLSWPDVVKPVLSEILDDKFIVIFRERR